MSKKYRKQKNEISQNCAAIAPYNFVELPDRVVQAQDAKEQQVEQQKKDGTEEIHPFLVRHDNFFSDRHTGTLSCTLVADSPIYIRTGLSPDDFAAIASTPFNKMTSEQKERYAKFFALYEKEELKPTLPGSSLRGMFRTLVEIAAHGKVSRVTDNKLFFRTLTDPTTRDVYSDFFVINHGSVRHAPNPSANCYGTLTRTGFLVRKPNGEYVIKECISGRIKRSDIPTKQNLYDGKGPGMTPNWNYQHRTIYVQIDNECDHFFPAPTAPEGRKPRHPNMYLRYRAITHASFSHAVGLQEGVLVLTGNMQHKKMEFVFLSQTGAEHPVPDEMIRRFHDNDQISQWQEKAFPKDQPLCCREKDGYLRNGEPVFFLLHDDGSIRFFGRAQMFRLPYERSPYDFIPEAIREPKDRQGKMITDLAEAMFGYVPDKDSTDTRHAYAGRVFVDDAPLLSGENLSPNEPDTPDKPYITPRILASPKPTTFQHYLVQVNEERKDLAHYASTPETDTVIRGHKLYWHQEQARKDTLEHDGQPQSWLHRIREDPSKDTKQSSQHTRMLPLAPGATFKVTLRFENLSDVELGALLWIVQLASDEGYRLKLGMGKPLGMGSVRFTDATVIRSNRKQRYTTLFDAKDTSTWKTGEAEMTEDEQKHCIQAFQQYVLRESHVKATSFDDLPRIKLLQLLLSWPGPAHDGRYEYPDRRPMPHQDLTRYMEIERPCDKGYVSGKPRNDKVNEYANRPVLPRPEQVLKKKHPEREPQQPEQQRSVIDTRKPGTVVTVATKQGPGEIVDEEKKPYLYTRDDVIGDNLVVDQHVRFHHVKRKTLVGQGKKKKEKNVSWAVNIEPYSRG